MEKTTASIANNEKKSEHRSKKDGSGGTATPSISALETTTAIAIGVAVGIGGGVAMNDT